MKSMLEMFVTECEYKNLSPLTVKTYKTDIGYLIEFLEGIGVTDIEKLSPETLGGGNAEKAQVPRHETGNASRTALTVHRK